MKYLLLPIGLVLCAAFLYSEETAPDDQTENVVEQDVEITSAVMSPGKEYRPNKGFDKTIAAWVEEDKVNPPPKGAILAIGSSSMRKWNKRIHSDFAPLTIVARGFGGSNMNDVFRYSDRIVFPYEPRAMIIYEGDNDTNRGISPETFIAKVNEFVALTHEKLPTCRLYFLAIKPSIKNWNKWPIAHKANELLKVVCDGNELLTYIDTIPGMLGENGEPKPDFYGQDKKHMSQKGYDWWIEKLKPILFENELQYEENQTEVEAE